MKWLFSLLFGFFLEYFAAPVGHGSGYAHDVFFTREMNRVDWALAVHFEYIQDIGRQFTDIDQSIHARRQDVDGFIRTGVLDHLFDVVSQVRATDDDIESVHFFLSDHERREFDFKLVFQLVLLDVFFYFCRQRAG